MRARDRVPGPDGYFALRLCLVLTLALVLALDPPLFRGDGCDGSAAICEPAPTAREAAKGRPQPVPSIGTAQPASATSALPTCQGLVAPEELRLPEKPPGPTPAGEREFSPLLAAGRSSGFWTEAFSPDAMVWVPYEYRARQYVPDHALDEAVARTMEELILHLYLSSNPDSLHRIVAAVEPELQGLSMGAAELGAVASPRRTDAEGTTSPPHRPCTAWRFTDARRRRSGPWRPVVRACRSSWACPGSTV